MASTNASGGVATSDNFLQLLKSEIASQLSTNFHVLNNHPRAADFILGVIGVESGMGYNWGNVSVRHPVLSGTFGIGKAYEYHPIIADARLVPTMNQTNLTQGRQAHSLLGVLGAYLIRGLESGSKSFPHVQGKYKEIAEGVGCLVHPGASLYALFTEDLAGLRRGLVPGMCILEYNYKIALNQNKGNKDSAMNLAIRRHLGDPNAADSVTGVSSSDYLARVVNNANGAARSAAKDTRARAYSSVAQSGPRSSPNPSGVTQPGAAPGCAYS